MTEPLSTIQWTETALRTAERIPDPRIRAQIVERVEALHTAPEQLDTPLTGEPAARAVATEVRPAFGPRPRDRGTADRGHIAASAASSRSST